MFKKMVEAHGKLAEAIADPKRHAGSLIDALDKFKDAVDDIANVFDKDRGWHVNDELKGPAPTHIPIIFTLRRTSALPL